MGACKDGVIVIRNPGDRFKCKLDCLQFNFERYIIQAMDTSKQSTANLAPESFGPDSLLLDNQLCFALYSASLTMTKLYKPLLQKMSLTYPQYLVLLTLWERDELTVSALGERLFLDSGTLTPLLKRLESSGFLRRQRSPHDERQVIVSLTAAGKNLRQQALEIPQQVSCSVECSLDEVKALTQELRRLRAAMAGNIA
ncbi:MAG: ohrR [Collimonas fungivorans]|nr:ohrR [Collimonas fungivorans]